MPSFCHTECVLNMQMCTNDQEQSSCFFIVIESYTACTYLSSSLLTSPVFLSNTFILSSLATSLSAFGYILSPLQLQCSLSAPLLSASGKYECVGSTSLPTLHHHAVNSHGQWTLSFEEQWLPPFSVVSPVFLLRPRGTKKRCDPQKGVQKSAVRRSDITKKHHLTFLCLAESC